jgi:hypothetical protein
VNSFQRIAIYRKSISSCDSGDSFKSGFDSHGMPSPMGMGGQYSNGDVNHKGCNMGAQNSSNPSCTANGASMDRKDNGPMSGGPGNSDNNNASPSEQTCGFYSGSFMDPSSSQCEAYGCGSRWDDSYSNRNFGHKNYDKYDGQDQDPTYGACGNNGGYGNRSIIR